VNLREDHADHTASLFGGHLVPVFDQGGEHCPLTHQDGLRALRLEVRSLIVQGRALRLVLGRWDAAELEHLVEAALSLLEAA